MAHRKLAVTPSDSDAATKVATTILDFIADIPRSPERKNRDPITASKNRANSAAAKAALAAGTLALPPGPLGWITILPEMVVVWKIQAQMVSDIASLYGKKATLTQEQMLYCLFRHSAAQAVRDLVIRVGERALVKSEYLFISRRTGKQYVNIHKIWERLRKKAGCEKTRLHDLRHMYASFLVNSGRTLYEVQQILGHSDPKVTMRYSHLSSRSLQDAANSASVAIQGALKVPA